MDPDIIQFIEKKIMGILLKDEPEIKLWCCKISSILKLVFCEEKHHILNQGDFMVKNQTIKRDDLTINFLSESEFQILNKFKSLKKQMEWLSGRFLLKSCLCSFVDNIDKLGKLEDIIISYEKYGAPFLPDFSDIKISLSHSGNWVSIGVCKKKNVNIGVDIEQFRQKPDKNFIKTAFTKKEISCMGNSVEEILKKWTAKEAFLKYIKKGFNENLHRVEVIKERVFYNQKDACISIFSQTVGKIFIISLVTGRTLEP